METDPAPPGRLAFVFYPPNAERRIYSVRTDGTDLRVLTPLDQMASAPAWSPDGSWLVYRADVGSYDRDYSSFIVVPAIWVVRSDGSNARPVALEGESPFWIGIDRVGYTCDAGLCAAGIDGSTPAIVYARATSADFWDDSYRLSPDGRRVLFVRHHRLTPTDEWTAIHLANVDGTGERRLTSAPSGPSLRESSASWSPDGSRILYLKERFVAAVVDAEGGEPRDFSRLFQLIVEFPFTGAPAWSPTGTHVVLGFDARRFYIARADGSGTLRRVSGANLSSTANDVPSAWSWSPFP